MSVKLGFPAGYQRFEIFSEGGQFVESHTLNLTATFVFFWAIAFSEP